MEQQITIEQYAELPEEQQLYFLEWMEKRGYSHLATIGQLLAFLNETLRKRIFVDTNKKRNMWQVQTTLNQYDDRELSYALWAAVKDVISTIFQEPDSPHLRLP